MRIVCPTCAAAYEVPEGMLGAGRPVRCARCGGEWAPATTTSATVGLGDRSAIEHVGDLPGPGAPTATVFDRAPQATEAAAAFPHAAAPSPFSELHAAAATPGAASSFDETTTVRAAWAASVVLLLALAWGAYAWRGEIMHAWPPSERLYAALGLA